MSETQHPVVKAQPRGTSLAPQSITEAIQFARLLAKSTMVPKDFRDNEANVLVAVQWGAEVGLGPMQALQNIAVINGRPAIWGDAAMALVRGHPACESVSEGVEGEGDGRVGFCTVKRRGEEPQTRRFSVTDAKKANLWGKAGPWTQYPERMLQLRARGFAIRDVFPDALRGVITVEEAQDTAAEPRFVQSTEVREVRPAVAEEETFTIIDNNGEFKTVRPKDGKPAHERFVAAAIGYMRLAKPGQHEGLKDWWENLQEPNLKALGEKYPDAEKAARDAFEQHYGALVQAIAAEEPVS